MLYLGADHRGYKLKEIIKKYLLKRIIKFEDAGNLEFNPKDDYPDFSFKVAKKVSRNPRVNKGLLLCGSGAGVCIAANRLKNVRAGLGISPKMVEMIRKDDDINILCLAADFTEPAKAVLMLRKFLETKFSGKARHKRRLAKIKGFV